jgi:hypothetical protein
MFPSGKLGIWKHEKAILLPHHHKGYHWFHFKYNPKIGEMQAVLLKKVSN